VYYHLTRWYQSIRPRQYLLVFFRWGNRLGLNMREYQHWTRHAESMEKRTAVQSVLRAEGISLWG